MSYSGTFPRALTFVELGDTVLIQNGGR
jgi:hypothetical protein